MGLFGEIKKYGKAVGGNPEAKIGVGLNALKQGNIKFARSLFSQAAIAGNARGMSLWGQCLIHGANQPVDIFSGLVRVINGELFFSRKSISTTFNHMLYAMSRSQFSASNDSVNNDIDLSLLTKREKSVIHLLAQGASNRDIAERLNISDHTVKTHLYSAFKKTSSRNRVELANWAQSYMAVSLSLQNTQ